MKEKYRSLAKNIFLFSLNSLIPKVLVFLLVPIYTQYLTPWEYGLFDLMNTTIMLLLPIFTLDIQDAVMRFSFDEAYKPQHVFSVAIRIILQGSIFVVLGTIAYKYILDYGIKDIYYLFFILMYITSALTNSVSMFCRGINQVGVIVKSSIINTLIFLCANIILIVYLQWGLSGYLLATLIGNVSSLAYIYFSVKLYKYFAWDYPKYVFWDMFRFSYPLIFSVIAWWVNNASDRYILTYFYGISVSGLFAMAYKIPNILSVFQNIFAQAWSISAIQDFDKEDTDGYIGKVYMLMSGAMSIICSLLILINVPIASFLFKNQFFEAWKFVPPLLIAVVFNAMALFVGSIFTAVRDTTTLSWTTIIGATTNVICNFIFIYYWQAYGAAVATLIGFAVVYLARLKVLRKHIRMKVLWKREIIVTLLLLVQMCFAYYGAQTIVYQSVISFLILYLYKKEWYSAINMLRKKTHFS